MMTVPTRVSIIIPAFNDQAGLSACLHAIAKQSYPADAIEVIAVDNGSTPALSLGTTTVTGARLIRCLTPGSYAARNAGVRTSSGAFLAFIDADCVPDSYWLLTGITALMSRGTSSMIGGEVVFTPPAVRTAAACYQLAVGFQQAENIRKKGFSVTANLFCTRDVYEKVGPFNEQLLSGGDLEWGRRAKQAGVEVYFEPNALVHTLPRMSLRSAIRQTRRVAGGRLQLGRSDTQLVSSDGLRPHRSISESVLMLLRTPELNAFERLKAIAVASVLRLVAVFEQIRIRLGGTPERR